jgi:hypothetical protein
MKRMLAAAAAAFAILVSSSVVSAETRGRVSVNDQPINAQQLAVLEYVYGPIQSGAYWYDPISGLWGMQGGPASGQIAAWLSLGGPLRSDASGSGTGVYVNGRELHPVDVERLRGIYGTVAKGRYWMAADGIGGREGPAIFNLGTAAGDRPVRRHYTCSVQSIPMATSKASSTACSFDRVSGAITLWS